MIIIAISILLDMSADNASSGSRVSRRLFVDLDETEAETPPPTPERHQSLSGASISSNALVSALHRIIFFSGNEPEKDTSSPV